MAADFNKPVTTDNYVDLLAMLRDNQAALARMFASGTSASNIPVGSVRFDSGKFQTWNGAAWDDVPVSIDGGGTGAQSAADARVALGANNAANLTTGVLGADRVPGLDAAKIISGTLTRDTSGNAATATYATSAGSAGNAATATKWATSRTISITGDASGTSGALDGSSNVSIPVVVANDSHSHTPSTVSGLVGWDQTWQDMSSSRESDTTYQNTTSRPITVNIIGNDGNQRDVQVSSNGTTWVRVGQVYSGRASTLSFIVPVGHYYRINGYTSLRGWAELR